MSSTVAALGLLTAAFIASISQILLKKSADEEQEPSISYFINRKVFVGYALLLLSMAINIYAFQGIDYKYGPVIGSSAYIFVAILSYKVLGERLSNQRLLGIALIAVGIIVFGLF